MILVYDEQMWECPLISNKQYYLCGTRDPGLGLGLGAGEATIVGFSDSMAPYLQIVGNLHLVTSFNLQVEWHA